MVGGLLSKGQVLGGDASQRAGKDVAERPE